MAKRTKKIGGNFTAIETRRELLRARLSVTKPERKVSEATNLPNSFNDGPLSADLRMVSTEKHRFAFLREKVLGRASHHMRKEP